MFLGREYNFMNKNVIACRCEEITYGELIETAAAFDCSARELKLRTRAGMGYCGGRTCGHIVEKIAQTNKAEQVNNKIPLKHQAPIRPVPFKILERNEIDAKNRKSQNS